MEEEKEEDDNNNNNNKEEMEEEDNDNALATAALTVVVFHCSCIKFAQKSWRSKGILTDDKISGVMEIYLYVCIIWG